MKTSSPRILASLFLLSLTVHFARADEVKPKILLPGRYANCISQKDDHGNPIPDASSAHGHVLCARDADGTLSGTSEDKTTVTDSDAVRACRKLGGHLPTEDEFIEMGNQPIGDEDETEVFFSSHISLPADESGNYASIYSDGYMYDFAFNRAWRGRVICMMP